MYLSGSKWSMRKKRRRPSHPLRILVLLLLIAGAVYLERVVVPTAGPLFVPTPTPTRSPAAILLEADSLYQAGNLDQSESAYREAIQVDPGKANYYVELARLQAWEGKLSEAETSARNALLIDPSSALASATLAWVLDLRANQVPTTTEQLDLLDQAREHMDKALTQNTNLARVHAYNAEILIDEYLLANENTYESARSEAEKAVQIDPESLDAHRAMAIVWESTGNYESALESYQAALRINGNLSLLHVKVGDMYLALNDTDSAIERYVRASSLAPTDVVPLRRIVRAYARVGQYARASQYAADAVRLNPSDPYLHGLLGQMYRKNNDLSRADEELTWAIRGGTIPATWTVNGLSIELNDQTQVSADVGVGETVKVTTQTTVGGGLLATAIEAVDPGSAEAAASSNDEVVGIVENMTPSVTIEGIRLDDGDQAVEMYYTYALALAESDQCDLAAEVAQAILLSVQDNDTARFNAEEALRICGDLETTPTPEASGTPES
jgi:tetratricopeptide (TPR) repeat protein